jgi:parallel beta-helix repeat protein
MTYTFKLARRLARFRVAAAAVATIFSLSCNVGADLTGPLPIEVDPAIVVLPIGGTQQFTLQGSSVGGSAVIWSASGGTISATGLYTAGSTTGTYEITASEPSGNAGFAAVLITTAAPVPPSSSDSGVAVFPGQSLQAAVDGNPAGTTFILKAGTHQNQTVVPKRGNSFIGEQGTVMDGGLVKNWAFRTPSGATGSAVPDSVTIRGIKITRYIPLRQYGAIMAGGDAANENANDWTVADCEISYNPVGAGIRVGNRMKILRNNIHHNGQIGMIGAFGADILIEGNEIAYNNTDGYTMGDEAGGFKITQSTGLIVRNNRSHHNQGPGMWTDYDNINVLYENNLVEDNASAGIFHEISQAAVIRNNTVRRNGLGNYSWLYGAGIQVSTSRNVEVYANTVEENARGIVGIMQNRGTSARYGLMETANLYVHDNRVTMSVVATDANGHGNVTGFSTDNGDNSYYTSKNNRFVNNNYILGTAPKYFTWQNQQLTEAQWQAYGQDVTGSITR